MQVHLSVAQLQAAELQRIPFPGVPGPGRWDPLRMDDGACADAWAGGGGKGSFLSLPVGLAMMSAQHRRPEGEAGPTDRAWMEGDMTNHLHGCTTLSACAWLWPAALQCLFPASGFHPVSLLLEKIQFTLVKYSQSLNHLLNYNLVQFIL